MLFLQDDAVPVRRVPFSNTSLVVSILTREHGLRECIAKGCRRPKSPMFGSVDYFIRAEAVWIARDDGALEILRSFDAVAERTRIRDDTARYAAAAFMCEATSAACRPQDPAPDVFDLLDIGLDHLDAGGRPLSAALFGMALLDRIGFAFQCDICVVCGAPTTPEKRDFVSFERGGVVCEGCRATIDAEKTEQSVLDPVRFLCGAGYGECERLALPKRSIAPVMRFVVDAVEGTLGRRMRSGRFLVELLHERRRRAAS